MNKIGDYAFSGLSTLTGLTISDGVSEIGARAFMNCTGLTNVNIPGSVSSIGDYAFSGCKGISELMLEKGISSVGASTFSGCTELRFLTLTAGIKSIGKSSFANCRNIYAASVADTITDIGDNAFSGCRSLGNVYYNGDESAWNKVKIGSGNDALVTSTVYYSISGPEFIELSKLSVSLKETENSNIFTVMVSDVHENCTAYGVLYDDNKRIVGVYGVPLDAAGTADISVDKVSNGIYVEIFVWNSAQQPVAETQWIEL